MSSDTEEDWSKFLNSPELDSNKRKLLNECKKYGVCVFVDDPAETAKGIYAELRGVASKAELEIRLNSKKAVLQLKKANLISATALVVAVASFFVALSN